MPLFVAPKILLPRKSIDLDKWSVIACDQFTSEPEYWDKVKSLVDNVPSTFHLILPETYLDEDMDFRINAINKKMRSYLRNNIFEEYKGFILVDRKTPFVKRRLGMIIAIDLDQYEFEAGKHGNILASEQTVSERIPPRVLIREEAPIELPHVLVLVDDAEDLIINDLYKNRKDFELLYNFDLNMDGGHLKGYFIKDTDKIIQRFDNLGSKLKLIVGDGNHSLAAAKVCWDNLKANLSDSDKQNHPARFALVELISLYDEGLTFEPIHRIIFNSDKGMIEGLKQVLNGSGSTKILIGDKEEIIPSPENPFACIKIIQNYLDDYLEEHPESEIDFIHGMKNTKSIVSKTPDAIGICMPVLKRDLLLPYITENGVLPRKSFSLGEAVEKRYYLEAKRIL